MPSRRGLSRRSVGIRPGVSRNSMVAGVVFLGRNWDDSQSRRSSGIRAMPTWPRRLAAGSGLTPVNQRKTVLLPDPAKPAMPTFMVQVDSRGASMKPSPGYCTMDPISRPLNAGRDPRAPTMCDDWMPVIRLPLTLDQFHQLPRNPAYKYEYF